MDIHRMRQGQHKHQHNNRQRGRNRGGRPGGNGGGNPINRVYESNGPDVKVRGTAQTIAEKYMQLARDAQSAGDIVTAESYYQHAEHYLRILAAAQAYNQMQGGGQQQGGGFRNRDEGFDEDTDAGLDDGDQSPETSGDEQPAMADASGEGQVPQQQQQNWQPRRQRNFDDRGERPQRGERPPRQHQQQDQAERPRGSEEQPRVAEDAADGWTGPQPSFLRRPAPATAEGEASQATPAPRPRRPFRERPARDAAEAAPSEAPPAAPAED